MEVITPMDVLRAPKHHDGPVRVGLPDPSYRAFELLYFAYVMGLGLAGVGKVFGAFAHWSRFLAPSLLEAAGAQLPDLLKAVGLLELSLAALIAAKPRAGGWLAAAWLTAGIANFLSIPGHYALVGCFGMLVSGAIALSYLAEEFGG
jgi:hypothetical protein